MDELNERRDEERRSPVGDLMLSALWSASGTPIAHGELMALAAERQMSVSQVLAWIEVAREGGLVDELTVDARPALLLTAVGEEVARNDRRRSDRRAC